MEYTTTVYDENRKQNTESFTIRINSDVLDKIRSYSKVEKTTVNAVISHLLSQAVDWDISAARAGWLPMPKPIILEILNHVSNEEIEKLVREQVKIILRDMLLTMRGRYDITEWLSINRSRAKVSNFHYSEIDEKDKTRIILRHDLGSKFSFYLRTFYEMAITELGGKAEFDLTPNTLFMIIDKKYSNKLERKNLFK